MVLRRFLIPLIQPIRKLIRNRTRPISYDEARERKEFFSKIYMVSSISVFTYLCYITFVNRIDFKNEEGMPPHLALLNRMNTSGNVRYIRLEGFKKTDDYEFDADALREEYRKSKTSQQDENKSSDSNSVV